MDMTHPYIHMDPWQLQPGHTLLLKDLGKTLVQGPKCKGQPSEKLEVPYGIGKTGEIRAKGSHSPMAESILPFLSPKKGHPVHLYPFSQPECNHLLGAATPQH